MAATADALLERLASAPGDAALFLDFDGVLAPIVARPDDARLPPETRVELERLAGRYALVSVVSGRASDDLRARVDIPGIVLVGSHGLELHPEAENWRRRIADFAAEAPWPAEHTELKGLTVAFHYRLEADEGAAVSALEGLAGRARELGLNARFGRKVLEVLPPVGANKGTAVRSLLDEIGLARALVAGDDATDLDSFRALDELECSVRVALVSDESPAALAEHADIVLTGTGAFLQLLRRL
ncbi:MAG TPA: trehalose-phosphatase [Gaiellaceae bacterium]